MFKTSEIEALQPPELSEVLSLWKMSVSRRHHMAVRLYEAAPTLYKAGAIVRLNALLELFATTIPSVESRRQDWQAELELLKSELRHANLLSDPSDN